MSKQKNDKTMNMNFPSLTIPRVFITNSEEDESSTPTTLMESMHRQGRLLEGSKQPDEDAESTAPLLNSGTATPLGEEACMPLNLGTFLASSQKLKAEIQNEEINLSALNDEAKNIGDNSANLEFDTDYPFVKWHWKFIRIVSSLITLFAILSCFSSSVFLIAHLPQKCDPQLNWYQGKVFYEISPDASSDFEKNGFEDLGGIALQLDYLKDSVNVDALRLTSILEVNNNDFPEQFSANATTINTNKGNIHQFQHLMENVEKRNMTLVIDIAVDSIIRDTTRLSELKMENTLKYWLHHGVHGFYLKGLTHFAQDPNLWKIVAKWKSLMDNYSSGFSKRRILIVSSDFLKEYSRSFPLNIDDIQAQFDLIDHHLDISQPLTLETQIQEGFRWDNGVNSWIMWNVGSLRTTDRLAHIFRNNSGCNPFVGSLMLTMGLPGSASIFYGDEMTARSDRSPDNISNKQFKESLASDTNHCASAASILRNFRQLRKDAVPLYMNAILKFDKDILESRKLNYNLKIIDKRLENTTTSELSNTYFAGETLSSSSGKIKGYIKLEQLKLTPGEGVLLLLDK